MSEKTTPWMRHLPVNKHGFASIYALCMLNVVTLCAITYITQAMATAAAQQEMMAFDAQIVAIYRIKTRLHQAEVKEIADMDTEEIEQTDEEKPEDVSQNPAESEIKPQYILPLKEETFSYQEIELTIEYQETNCRVFFNGVETIWIEYDLAKQNILDFAYL